MAEAVVTVEEQFISRAASGLTGERIYTIRHTDDEDVALAEMLAVAPATKGSRFLDSEASHVEEIAASVFVGVAVYTSNEFDVQTADSFHLSFDISGIPTRVTQAKKHIGEYAAEGFSARKFRGAINVTDAGVEGTEILVPYFSYQVNYTFEAASITQDYVLTLAQIVGTVNNTTFHGFVAGELLLARVSGQKRPDGKWDVSFGFAVSRNATNVMIGDNNGAIVPGETIVVPEKKGWDFLWVYYFDDTIDVSGEKYTVKVPASAHLERVYTFTNYGLLNI